MKQFLKQNALLLIGGIVIVISLFRGFFASLINDQESEDLIVVNASISDNQAMQFADALHVAMGSMGTDFASIYNIFIQLTKQDYYKVHNKFSDRGYVDFLGVGIDIFYPKKLNLKQWLHSELSSKELLKLKSVAPYLSF